ncbi:MAG TPA: hypothetical protein VNT75_29250 [Symbiobacteriaceae bacterium]|nr:hypothetical protein [Symbiobacteriaceae bacterium]
MFKKQPKVPKSPAPAKKKKKKPFRQRLGYWLLVVGTVLGVAAGVSYAVPIPGLTAVSASTDPVATDKKTDEKKAEQAQQPSPQEELQAELDAREAKLKEKEAQVSTLLKDLTTQKAELDPLRQAAVMYENMPPYKAGPMMEAMDPAKAAQILKLVDEDTAGAIISYMDKSRGALVMNEMLKAQPAKPVGN